MKKLVIFGAGKVTQAITYYFDKDDEYEICAHICDPEFISSDTVFGKPLYSAEEVEERFPPDKYEMFVAIGYQGLNSLRTDKYKYYKSKGYKFAKYVSPELRDRLECGENTIIMDHVAVQPHAVFGNNVMVFGGAMIGHHTVIKDNCWLTGSCAIGGLTEIGENTFIGLNTTVGHAITVGSSCIIGANAIVCNSIGDNVVLALKDTPPHKVDSKRFVKLSSCFRI